MSDDTQDLRLLAIETLPPGLAHSIAQLRDVLSELSWAPLEDAVAVQEDQDPVDEGPS